MSCYPGIVPSDKLLSNLQVVNNLSVMGTLRAKEIVACASTILSGSVGDVEIENVTVNDAVIGAGTITTTFLQNVNAIDFDSGCWPLVIIPGANITTADLDDMAHFYRVGRVVHMSIRVNAIVLTVGTNRGTVSIEGTAVVGNNLPGRTTPFTTTFDLSGTGTISKSGTVASPFGGMFAFAEGNIGGANPRIDIRWIGDSASIGVLAGQGGAVTLMYETDGPQLCTP